MSQAWERRHLHVFFLAEPELRLLERSRPRWKNNTEVDLAERDGVWNGFV